MILGLKDNRHRAALEKMSSEMVRVLGSRAPEIVENPSNSVIVFVPRSEKARREAGHDQSYLLARRISEKTGIELENVFISRGKKAQKTLNKEQRMENAELNYDIVPEIYDFRGKTAIIVDDIITSGSSVGVCGGMLIGAGAERVVALVYAKTERY
jgi:predicted amidophosphoribosyltransferase